MNVILIDNPPFRIDFQEVCARKIEDRWEKVHDFAMRAFSIMKIMGAAAVEALWANIRYSWTTFKYIVLGYNERTGNFDPPQNNNAMAIALSVWIGVHAIGVIAVTVMLFLKKYRSLPIDLLNVAPKNIDATHMKMKSTSIDVSHVPEEIKVRGLLTLFDKINFTDSKKPGYMAPLSRREGDTVYSIADLRKHLTTFVERVEKREAFLGTPPTYMAPQLMKFYQQIQDAVRFSMHKVNTDLEDYLQSCGESGPGLDPKYSDLLENQARLVIDLAIAGNHCGGRYMGDAMDAYFGMRGDLLLEEGTLKDKLCAVLSRKREECARADIVQYHGTDTHAFSAYMANMGGLLGIAGTENVIEYLGSINVSEMAKCFFLRYNADYIRKAIQEEVKRSQILREAITDWIQDQVGEWKKEKYDGIASTIHEAATAPQSISETSKVYTSVEVFLDFWNTLSAAERAEAQHEDWNEFLGQLFVLDAAKRRWKTPLERQSLKGVLQREGIKEALQNHLKREDFEALKRGAQLCDQVDLINRTLSEHEQPGLSEETLFRCLRHQATLKEVIRDHLEHSRKAEFLEAIAPAETIATEGLSKNALDWLLLTHHILKPVASPIV